MIQEVNPGGGNLKGFSSLFCQLRGLLGGLAGDCGPFYIYAALSKDCKIRRKNG